MQSAKRSPKIDCSIQQTSMPNCCGVGMLTRHAWHRMKSYMNTNPRYPELFGQYRYVPVTNKQLTDTRISRDLFERIRNSLANYELLYIALPQNTLIYKRVTKWYLKHHFKKENETMSKHGEYKIFVLSITRAEWEKHYAL